MKRRFLVTFIFLFTASIILLFHVQPTSSQSSGVTLGQWQATPEFDGNSHPYPSFARDGYYYVHAKTDGPVYFARPNADGSITSWSEAWDHHGGVHGFAAIVVDGTPYHFRNGHIARYPFKSDGTVDGDVVLQEPSGDLEYAFDGRLWVWDTVVYAPLTTGKYVYHLGGFSCPGGGCGVSYQYNGDIFMSSVPIGDKFTETGKEHPEERPGKSVFYAPNGAASYGFIYTKGNQGNTLYKIRVNSDGSLGNWQSVGDLPSGSGNNRGDIFIINNTLFAIRGSKVFSVELNPTSGDLSQWSDNPPDLPEDQVEVTWAGELEGPTWGIIGNYVYVSGPSRVYYAQINGSGTTNPTPTHSPTPPPGATNTPTPSDSDPTPTPTPISDCAQQQRNGDYNCSGNVDETDYTDWLEDYEQGVSTLTFFEYWRRALY
ncbi:hypothetical protein HY469_03985 [Candidatus Roizmanbacteria bacterium]|nr:hypothetical protein [Candidatus Roizmanbacteria bacterium]